MRRLFEVRLAGLFYKMGRQEKCHPLNSTSELFSLGVQPRQICKGLFLSWCPMRSARSGKQSGIPVHDLGAECIPADFTILDKTRMDLQLLLSSGRICQPHSEPVKQATRIVPHGRLMSGAQVEVAVPMLFSDGAEDTTRSTSLVDGGGSLFFRGEYLWVT